MSPNAKSNVDYSIVIPVYYNEGLLKGTMESIKREVVEANPDLIAEVIFIDDGSGDGSLRELMEIREKDPDLVKIIQLTRNFGQVNALLAGYSHARGKCIILLSADGQDPPHLINKMLSGYYDEHYEIVACSRQGRDESYYRILTSKLFYFFMRRLSFPNMPLGGFDFVLLGRRALNALLDNKEAHPFFQGQILWTGFKIKFIEYRRQQRRHGKSRWTFAKKITYLLDGVIGYSFSPLRFMSIGGIVIALLGIGYAASIFILRIIGNIPVKGWAPLMIVILVMGGIQMLMLGVIGEYLWRTLAQVRNRAPYIIQNIYDNEPRRNLQEQGPIGKITDKFYSA